MKYIHSEETLEVPEGGKPDAHYFSSSIRRRNYLKVDGSLDATAALAD